MVKRQTLGLLYNWRRSDGSVSIRNWILWSNHNARRSQANIGLNTRRYFKQMTSSLSHTEQKKKFFVKVPKVLKWLDEANVNLNLGKCVLAANEIAWVGYELSQQGAQIAKCKEF